MANASKQSSTNQREVESEEDERERKDSSLSRIRQRLNSTEKVSSTPPQPVTAGSLHKALKQGEEKRKGPELHLTKIEVKSVQAPIEVQNDEEALEEQQPIPSTSQRTNKQARIKIEIEATTQEEAPTTAIKLNKAPAPLNKKLASEAFSASSRDQKLEQDNSRYLTKDKLIEPEEEPHLLSNNNHQGEENTWGGDKGPASDEELDTPLTPPPVISSTSLIVQDQVIQPIKRLFSLVSGEIQIEGQARTPLSATTETHETPLTPEDVQIEMADELSASEESVDYGDIATDDISTDTSSEEDDLPPPPPQPSRAIQDAFFPEVYEDLPSKRASLPKRTSLTRYPVLVEEGDSSSIATEDLSSMTSEEGSSRRNSENLEDEEGDSDHPVSSYRSDNESDAGSLPSIHDDAGSLPSIHDDHDDYHQQELRIDEEHEVETDSAFSFLGRNEDDDVIAHSDDVMDHHGDVIARSQEHLETTSSGGVPDTIEIVARDLTEEELGRVLSPVETVIDNSSTVVGGSTIASTTASTKKRSLVTKLRNKMLRK
eukprot:sb/3463668/